MKLLKYITPFILLICVAVGCKKDGFSDDTSFATSAPSATNLSVMFDITHDNSGVVTITPNGSGAISYDITFGDASSAGTAHVAAGKSVQHTYAEGNYQVKLVAHDLKGGTATLTQALVVSFLAPENLTVNLTKTNLTVNVSATAKYATFFKIYFGDSTKVTPVPFTNALPGQAITHNYAAAGTYIVTVVALSGGSETTQKSDTITVAKQINLPVTFEDPNTDYTMSDFGGNISSLVVDPTNSSNHVEKAIKTAGAQTYAGTTIGTSLGFATPVPLNASTMTMTVNVYSPAVGIDVKLKLDNHTNPNNGLSVETDVLTTVANKWETLTFDFSKPASGTPAYNAANTYDLASIFFDFGNVGTGATYYFDNVQIGAPTLKQINLPVTFDDATVDYTMSDFGGNVSSLVVDPTNSSNHVEKAIKTAGAATYAGTTIGTGLGFATPIPLTPTSLKMTVMVYSPAAGIDVKLKLDNHKTPNVGLSVETDVLTTVANKWETLTFDFSKPAAGTSAYNSANTYDLASIFFDFGNAGTGSVFYFDNVQMAPPPVLKQINLPVTFDDPTVDYTMSDFGGNVSTLVADPTNASNNVMQSVKTAGSATYAGTTIGTTAGFATAIPISSSRMKMTVMVYSPAVGLDVKLKLDNHANPNTGLSVETDVLTTVANKWETLTFDFSKNAAGTPAYNPANTYDLASIFFDFGNAGTGSTFYWDNVILL
jgi:hypothetical protein